MSVITAISIGGILIGVLTMIVTLSVMGGFERELKEKLFVADTHILIEPVRATDSADPFAKATSADVAAVIDRIKRTSSKIQSVFPVLQTEAIVKAGDRVAGGVMKGIDHDQWVFVQRMQTEWASEDEMSVVAGSGRALVGTDMAYQLVLAPSETISVVSPLEGDGPMGAVPRVKKFAIEGVFRSGVPETDMHVVFARRSDVESLLRRENVISQYEVRVERLEDAPDVSKVLAREMGSDFVVRPWQELNAHLFHSLKLERAAMFVVLVFIVIVATFNIISTLTMMVIEKRRSLSILRAMGATPKQIEGIFVWEGAAIGLLGVGFGAAIGLVICLVISKFAIIELPEMYYDRTLPVAVDPFSVLSVIGVALLVVFIGTLVPARKAGRLPLVETIRQS